MYQTCCHLFNLPVRTCTRSRIFTPVADVLQKYLCTRINPVFISIDRVHILIDVERNEKAVQECHIEIAPQRIPCSPAHHQGSPKILQRAFIATNSRHIAHAKKKQPHSASCCPHSPPSAPCKFTLVDIACIEKCVHPAVN